MGMHFLKVPQEVIYAPERRTVTAAMLMLAAIKWKKSWIRSAANGRCAFCLWWAPTASALWRALRRLLDGVTHKMLSNQLKELAADGLVQRIDYNEVPPRVEYRLTENGEALMPIFDDIQNYIRRQSCGDCCKQETRHTCCE